MSRNPPQCVSYSVSPSVGNDASPLFGTASATQDVEVTAVEIGNDAPLHEAADQELRVVPGEPVVLGEVGGEEKIMPRVGRRPILPTKAEVEEHDPLHLHYRDWCSDCRAGKGRLAPHLVDSLTGRSSE